ncbi:hypothetical protein ZWY2020_044521 [Hordeum vulgare]|nr:hypothetical protein ZWY2020_044521 [Hordeum vulgare]
MEPSLVAAALAAHPDGGRVTAAAVVGCICLDHLACTECDRILGIPFLPIDARSPSPRRASTPGLASGSGSPPVPMARVSVGLRLGIGPSTGGDGARAEGFGASISGMAERLGLAAAVGDRAEEVFRKMEEARAWPRGPGWAKGRSRRDSGRLYAACLSIACRNEGSPRSLRELAMATADGSAAARKEIAKLTAHIRKRLGEEEAGQATGVGAVPVSGYLRRFGPLLGLGDREAAAAWEAARRLEGGALEVRHNAEALAAAVVCMALERAGARRHIREVATATGIPYATIYLVCRKMRPHTALLFD